MKFSLSLLGSSLLATALAAPAQPQRSTLESRIARRAGNPAATRTRLTHPLIPLGEGITPDADGNNTFVQYSGNWAGAVITAPPAGQTFNAASGQFTVPHATGSGSGSAWVGIDGDTYGNAILQSGIDWTVNGAGANQYDAWYEWYPNYAFDFSGISMSAGNVMSVSIQSSSSSAGTVVLQNLSTGKSVSKSLTAPSSSSNLGGQNAEWIVEDFDSGGSQVQFANFGTVQFTNAAASTAQQSVAVSSAQIIDIKSGNTVLTDVSISGTSVTVNYV